VRTVDAAGELILGLVDPDPGRLVGELEALTHLPGAEAVLVLRALDAHAPAIVAQVVVASAGRVGAFRTAHREHRMADLGIAVVVAATLLAPAVHAHGSGSAAVLVAEAIDAPEHRIAVLVGRACEAVDRARARRRAGPDAARPGRRAAARATAAARRRPGPRARQRRGLVVAARHDQARNQEFTEARHEQRRANHELSMPTSSKPPVAPP
jgi:hypothetical protein